MALNAYQQAVSDLAKRLGLKGAAESQVYQRPEYLQLVEQMYGKIPLPPGIDPSQVITNDGARLEYKDAEGYVHVLTRDLNGTSSQLGQVSEAQSNRPPILPPPPEQAAAERGLTQQTLGDIAGRFQQGVPAAPQLPDFSALQNQLTQFPRAPQMPDFSSLFSQLNQPIAPPPSLEGIFGGLNALQPQYGNLQDQLNQVFSRAMAPQQLPSLQPGDVANLDAIYKSIQAQQGQQFEAGQSNLLTRLYGQGVNQSTIANQATADLLQAQGMLGLQSAADDAARRLGVQTTLYGGGLQSLGLAGQTAAQGFTGLGQQAQSLLGQGNLALQGYGTQQGLNLQRLQQLASGMGQQGQLALGAFGAEQDVRTNQLSQLLQSLLGQGQLGLGTYQAQQGFNQDLLGQMMQQFNQLANLDLSRQVQGGQLGLGQASLAEQMRQFNLGLSQQQEQLRAQERAARGSIFDQIMRGLSAGVSIAAAPFTGGTSLFGLAGLGGGGKTSSLPTVGF